MKIIGGSIDSAKQRMCKHLCCLFLKISLQRGQKMLCGAGNKSS